MRVCKALVFFSIVLTIGVFVVWGLTGREIFTKRVRLYEVERAPDPEDFLDIAKADADGLIRETRRDEGLWFGLLPSGHPRPGAWGPEFEWASVVSVAGPAWLVSGGLCLIVGARSRRQRKSPED